MAFVTPTDVATGEVLTASRYNQDVVENVRFYLPTGSLVPYAGAAAPTEFLLCDGAAVSRSTYADLFDVCGTTYGAGNGSTTFNLPDLRGRMPIGAGTGAQNGGSGTGVISGGTALTARTRGAFGGDERLASHTHVLSANYHLNAGTGGNDFRITDGNGGLVGPVTATTGSSGSGSGGNMTPFIVANYIIKT